MARPKSRNGGRVTPKGTRSHGRSGQRSAPGRHRPKLDEATIRELKMLVVDIEDCIETYDGTDLIETEKSVSCIIGLHITSNWNPYGVRAAVALAHAEAIGTPAGAVIAAGVSVYGPALARERARQVLDRIRAADVAVPEWVGWLGTVEPVGATKFRDEWDEYCEVVVEYARPDGSIHEVGVGLHPFGQGMAHDFTVAPAGVCSGRLAEAGFVAEEIDLAETRGLLASGVELLDEALKDWWDNDLDFDAEVDLRPLVGQRIETLPGSDRSSGSETDGGADAEHIADIVRGFVEQPVPLGEQPGETAAMVMAAVVFSQACRDPDVLRWSPPRIKAFIEMFVPMWREGDDPDDYDPFDEFGKPGDAFEFDEERLSTVDSAFPRWLRYTAECRGDSAETLEANLAAARSSLRKLRVKITGSPIPLAATARATASIERQTF